MRAFSRYPDTWPLYVWVMFELQFLNLNSLINY